MLLRQISMGMCAAAFAVAQPFAQAMPRGSTVEAATADAGYDFVVHVRNRPDYKYNPVVRADRIGLATALVRPFCARSQVVNEAVFSTEIFGLVTGGLDYVEYVLCLR